jgi:hypothetical protein
MLCTEACAGILWLRGHDGQLVFAADLRQTEEKYGQRIGLAAFFKECSHDQTTTPLSHQRDRPQPNPGLQKLGSL